MVPQTTFFSDDSDHLVVSYCPFCKPSTNFLLPWSVFALFLSWIRSVVILDLCNPCSCVRSSVTPPPRLVHMKRAADFQSGIKSDKLKACNTATNLNEHMLADRQTWPLTKEQLQWRQNSDYCFWCCWSPSGVMTLPTLNKRLSNQPSKRLNLSPTRLAWN